MARTRTRRTRPRLPAAARGYDHRHRAARDAYLARYRPGQPCARCGLPLWPQWRTARDGRRISMINLGHTPDRTAYTGLEHEHCNKSEGATRGNRQRGMQRAVVTAGRRW